MVGNTPNFEKIDILRCFLRFNKNLSRKELSESLDLGEGTLRTILNLLKEKNLLDSTKKGHFLSKKGKDLLDEILKNISIPKKIVSKKLKSENVGIQIKNVKKIPNIISLRDVAVKNGADGAIILKFKDKLLFPESDYQEDYSELEHQFQFNENDILVVGFSENQKNAEKGALVSSLELNNNLKEFLAKF